MRKNAFVMIPTDWLSDYEMFPKRLLHGGVVLCTKNPYRFGDTIYKIVPVCEEETHKPEDCRCHTIRTYDGQSGCLGTKEIDPCKGETCENWKPKEE